MAPEYGAHHLLGRQRYDYFYFRYDNDAVYGESFVLIVFLPLHIQEPTR